MSKHTHGLWRRRPSTLSIEGPDGRLVANALCGTMRRTTTSPPERSRVEAEANANLIAAAPELLRGLRDALDCINEIPQQDRVRLGLYSMKWVNDALEAIAKATGEQA